MTQLESFVAQPARAVWLAQDGEPSGALQSQLQDTQARLERLQAHVAGLQHELQAMEESLSNPASWAAQIKGRRIVYVGGRPRSNAALRALVQQAGGEFVLHAGLVHDDGRATGLAALLPGADRVFCPLDLIDPESLAGLRRLCARHDVAWQPLRSASVTSFVAGLLRPVAQPVPLGLAPAPSSRFCPRHR